MYANALKNTPSYTHVSLYVVWRVHPLGQDHIRLFKKPIISWKRWDMTKMDNTNGCPYVTTVSYGRRISVEILWEFWDLITAKSTLNPYSSEINGMSSTFSQVHVPMIYVLESKGIFVKTYIKNHLILVVLSLCTITLLTSLDTWCCLFIYYSYNRVGFFLCIDHTSS